MDASLSLAGRLVQQRLLSEEEMERVTKLQAEQDTPLIRLVVELGFVSEDDLLPVLRDYFGVPLIALKDMPATPLPIEFSENVAEFCKHARMVPVKVEQRELHVAVTDPGPRRSSAPPAPATTPRWSPGKSKGPWTRKTSRTCATSLPKCR